VLAIINRVSRPQLVLAGVAGGFVWGILARLWMRLIATDPDFTWGGTIFILIATSLFGLGVGGAAAGRRSLRRWVRRVTRVLGAIPLILLSAGAGMIMVATIVPMTLALTERRWWKPVRLALLALSLLPAKVVVDGLAKDFSGLKAAIALVLYVGLAAVLVIGWGSIVGSRKPRKSRRLDAARELPVLETVAPEPALA
jgi:hypothetical protein